MTKKDLGLAVVRYSLSLAMMPYALSKIFQTQFVLPGFSLAEPEALEFINSKTLAWAFLGYSGWFQILLGCFELVPALLMIFRRTTFVGASLMLPVTLNIVLVNFALNLWTGTKVISVVLLLLNILIFIFEWAKVSAIYKAIINYRVHLRYPKTEIIFNIIIISIAVYYFGKPMIDYRSQRDVLSGDWLNKQPLVWELQREESLDSIARYRNVKLYFGPGLMYKEFLDGEEVAGGTYEIDKDNHKVTFKGYEGEKEVCSYILKTESSLQIVRVDKQRNSKTTQYYWSRMINSDTQH